MTRQFCYNTGNRWLLFLALCNRFLKQNQLQLSMWLMCNSCSHCLPAGCLTTAKTSGQISKHHCLVGYTAVFKQIFSCRHEHSTEVQWGGCLSHAVFHMDSLLLSVYVNFTKERSWIIQKWGPHHHPKSHDLPAIPSARLLMVTWLLQGSHGILRDSHLFVPRFSGSSNSFTTARPKQVFWECIEGTASLSISQFSFYGC